MAGPILGVRSVLSLDLLAKELKLGEKQVDVLRETGARTAEEFYSVFVTFPNLALATGLNVAEVTNYLANRGGESFSLFLAEAQEMANEGLPELAMGADAPADSMWTHGAEVPVHASEVLGSVAEFPTDVDAMDVRKCLPWAVRNQATRGTCVSFAVTALREALDCERGLGITDLSEQFFYYAIKRTAGEPFPGRDGTLIEFAASALRADGVCPEEDWAYNPLPIPGNPGQGGPGLPSAGAIGNAAARRYTAAIYERGRAGGNAARLVALLREDRPVAISVPVFSDPLLPSAQNNWTTPLGRQVGWIAEPQQTSFVSGGHAVCVTGFVADSEAPGGGWFIVRNSWGPLNWGRDLPRGGYVGPEPGYGQISWQYVERFLWEVCQL